MEEKERGSSSSSSCSPSCSATKTTTTSRRRLSTACQTSAVLLFSSWSPSDGRQSCLRPCSTKDIDVVIFELLFPTSPIVPYIVLKFLSFFMIFPIFQSVLVLRPGQVLTEFFNLYNARCHFSLQDMSCSEEGLSLSHQKLCDVTFGDEWRPLGHL